ncbi:hypothetical protein BGX24_001237, partial [Mortierella sp. AD032]
MESLWLAEVMKKTGQGDMHIRNDLGEMYMDSRRLRQDKEAVMFWFLKAAEQGHDYAQTN